MQRPYLILLLSVVLSYSLTGWAAPLGTIPTMEDRNLRLIMDFRSDMWTSPYSYKSAPLRIVNNKFRIPIYNRDSWKASIEFETERFGLGRSDISLGKENVFIGSDFRTENMGFGLNREMPDGSSFSLFGAWATASDRPFGSARDSWLESTLLYRTALMDGRRWIYALNHSNNRGVLNGKPILYVGVAYEENENFSLSYGFPFFRISWDKQEEWTKSFLLTYFGSRFEVETKLQDDFLLNASTGFSVRSFLHDERKDDNERLYYQEMSVEIAIRKQLSSRTGFTFGVGCSFDRRLYETETLYAPNSKTTVMDSDAYTRLAMDFIL